MTTLFDVGLLHTNATLAARLLNSGELPAWITNEDTQVFNARMWIALPGGEFVRTTIGKVVSSPFPYGLEVDPP